MESRIAWRLSQRQRLIRKLDEDLRVAADCAEKFRKDIEAALAARLARRQGRPLMVPEPEKKRRRRQSSRVEVR